MKFSKTPLDGAYVIDLEPFTDERGLFVRTFCLKDLRQIGFDKQIVQINHSLTKRQGAVRGMHFQLLPACEAKFIRCIQGKVFDVMVDLRAGSSTCLQWHGVELSKENQRMVFIPEGFAHGFQTLTDHAELIYLHTAFYTPESERGLRFDDPALGIRWPLPATQISPKDESYPFICRDFKGIET